MDDTMSVILSFVVGAVVMLVIYLIVWIVLCTRAYREGKRHAQGIGVSFPYTYQNHRTIFTGWAYDKAYIKYQG
jgi:hypothetical protein